MICISIGSGKSGPLLRAEGQAVGASGVEFVRAVRHALEGNPGVDLELDALGSIDQSTVEFLAECGDQVQILTAPTYVSRWLDAIRRIRALKARSA